ncbi:type IV pilus modification PilV family protein [Aeromonas media]|uniref:type IV pilus modification PilV family protein n=1 Tax=Aeromonas media TaxID=651 RepID=UPI00295357F0|nr:prepilin-type N-terminal cleavage/methylation domain-containing protein [Aeromonas media]WOQ13910.1 prepilin-type N-terminal cleavage/methylation domain-containing protein [Aeromonas media]
MKRQLGFGLLEILITMVVLGVAVVGLVVFSKSALVASQEGRSYEIAMRLAESKLDEFRNFNSATTAAIPFTAYNDISTNSTGTKLTQYGVDYYITWVAKDQYWNKASSVWQDSPPSGYSAPTSGQKVVTVTVTWQGKQLQLSSNISPGSSLLGNELDGGLDSSRSGPKVAFNPGSVPDVVVTDLDLEGVNKKEASKPLPDISKSGSSLKIQFDTTTYEAMDGTSTQIARQDFVTVSCSCKFESNGNKADAYLPALPSYIESNKVQYWKVGETVDKIIGVPSDTVNNQDELCSSSTTNCCRDHYDVTTKGFAGYYNPLNLQRAVSGYYQDACRFVRLDGIYRPAPDWHLASLTIFPDNFLQDSTNLKNYQDYIVYVVTTHAKWQKTAFSGKTDSSWSAPSSSPDIPSFNNWLGSKCNPQTNEGCTMLKTSIGTRQLISRGIYVDIMPPSYLNGEVFKDGAEPALAKIPFQDVNMTLLSEWSSSSSKALITSDAINTIVDPDNNYYGTYSRGKLTAISTTYSGTKPNEIDSPITITATSNKGNFGVVGSPISQDNQEGAISATMLVSIDNQPIASTQGVIECLKLETTTGNNGKVTNKGVPCDTISSGLKVFGSNGVWCDLMYIGHPSKAGYSCTGAPSVGFTLTLQMNVGEYQFSPASPQALTLPSSGVSDQPCVMMVEKALVTALPATKTTCNTKP